MNTSQWKIFVALLLMTALAGCGASLGRDVNGESVANPQSAQEAIGD